MNALKYPEDSILSRHFESTVELNRQRWLQSPPSDSILRRHAMSQSNQADMRSESPTASRQATAASSPSPAAVRNATTDNRGFFSKLIGYLTGRG
ncbi:MAG: hypothetical protein P8103_05345 [Candidatus Thiodiazotropha sp.]